MEKNREMLENPSDGDNDIESGDFIIVRQEPLYHTDDQKETMKKSVRRK